MKTPIKFNHLHIQGKKCFKIHTGAREQRRKQQQQIKSNLSIIASL